MLLVQFREKKISGSRIMKYQGSLDVNMRLLLIIVRLALDSYEEETKFHFVSGDGIWGHDIIILLPMQDLIQRMKSSMKKRIYFCL